MTPSPLVLASGSPRRRELLALLGLPFERLSPDVDESPRPREEVAAWAERLAREKAQAGLSQRPHATIVAADTLVSLPPLEPLGPSGSPEAETGRITFGKPQGAEDAKKQLRLLSGREHEVYTGVCVANARRLTSQTVVSRVRLRAFSEAELAWYVGTGEPLDKAGSYAVQGQGALFVKSIEGSWTSVVGLPVAELCAMLEGMGVPLPWLR